MKFEGEIIANEGVSWIDADIKYIIGKTNPITFRNSINNYRLQGAHMPTDYDMITRVRAKEHVSDQIHLVTAHEPFKYPKLPKKDTSLGTVQVYNIPGNNKLYIWSPVVYATYYIVAKEKAKRTVYESVDLAGGTDDIPINLSPLDEAATKKLVDDGNGYPSLALSNAKTKYSHLKMSDLYYPSLSGLPGSVGLPKPDMVNTINQMIRYEEASIDVVGVTDKAFYVGDTNMSEDTTIVIIACYDNTFYENSSEPHKLSSVDLKDFYIAKAVGVGTNSPELTADDFNTEDLIRIRSMYLTNS